MSTYSDLKGGIETTVYSTAADLPLTGVSGGAQAYVTETHRLYLWNGSGWYNIALINTAPTITTGAAGSYTLAKDGTATVITLVATDPEGVPITWSHSVTTGTLGSTAVVTQSTNVFTVTPSSTAADGGTFSLTFTASDGINVATSTSAFILSFTVANSRYTTLLATAVSTGDNNNITDASSSNHTITVAGDTHAGTFSPYRHGGYSVEFDGDGDYLQTTLSETIGTSQFTIECWVRMSTVGGPEGVFGIDTTALPSSANGLAVFTRSSTYSYNWGFLCNGTQTNSSTAPSAGTWYHLALVRDSNNLVTMYIDGTSIASSTEAGSIGGDVLTIGIYWTGTFGWNGNIQDFRIIKGTAVYTANFTPPTQSLTAITNTSLLTCHLPYIADGSSNAHTITVNGNVTTNPFIHYDHAEYDTGTHGGSVHFDGTGDWLAASSGSTDFGFGTGDFTMEFWLNPTTVTNPAQSLLSMLTSASDTAPHIYLDTTIRFFESGSDRITGSTLAAGQWYHIALCKASSNTKLFVNGTQVGNTYSDSRNYGTNKPCVVGSYYSGGSVVTTSTVNSYISDLRVVKGTAVYTSNFTAPTAPLSSSGSSLHIKGTDASIIDKSQGSNLKLVGNTTGSTTQAKFSNTKSMLFPTSSGDYLQTTLSETIGTSQFTIECWVRRDTLGGPEGVFGIDTTALPAGTNGLAVYTGGTPYNWGFFINGTQTNTTTAPSAGTWYHLALVRDANNLVTMYIDGTSIDSDTYTDSIDGNVLTIGVYYTGTFGWNGNIQDFRITKGLARYTANFTPPTAPLIG
jgi:hypothetical protein